MAANFAHLVDCARSSILADPRVLSFLTLSDVLATLERELFSNSKKLAQQTAQRLISGHLTLITWWALKHAGVFEAMLKMEADSDEGVDPLVHATRSNMAPEVLFSMLEYLATSGLINMRDGRVWLTPEGRGLLEQEDGLLEWIRSCEPVVDAMEHLLARLKVHGPSVVGLRKPEAAVESQTARYAEEVFPAIREIVQKQKFSHVLDAACGSGELLVDLATHIKTVVGIGTGGDGFLVRRANVTISESGLEKRLIAVTANAVDIFTDTRRVFDRIGISAGLREEIDCIIVVGLAHEVLLREASSEAGQKASAGGGGNGGDPLIKVLSAVARNFPKACLLLAEPTAGSRFEKNYYAPEMAFLMRLCRATPRTVEQWREIVGRSGFRLLEETPLVIDGVTLFLCRAGASPA